MLKALTIEIKGGFNIATFKYDGRNKKFILCNNGHCVVVENCFKYTKIIHKTIKISIMKLLLQKAEAIVEKDRFDTCFDGSPPVLTLLTETGEIIETCYYSDELTKYYNEIFETINRRSLKNPNIDYFSFPTC